MSFLDQARKLSQQWEARREETKSLEELRETAKTLGVGLSPIKLLETIDWPWAETAAVLSFIRCGRAPDSDSLEVAAALLLQIVDASEKSEKGEKPETRHGLTAEAARALLIRIYCGQQVRLTDDGQIEMIDG
jgi:hypothetical protein